MLAASHASKISVSATLKSIHYNVAMTFILNNNNNNNNNALKFLIVLKFVMNVFDTI